MTGHGHDAAPASTTERTRRSASWILKACGLVILLGFITLGGVLTCSGIRGGSEKKSTGDAQDYSNSAPAPEERVQATASAAPEPLRLCKDKADLEVTLPVPTDTADPDADANWSEGYRIPAGCRAYTDRAGTRAQCRNSGEKWRGMDADGRCDGVYERLQSTTGEADSRTIMFREY